MNTKEFLKLANSERLNNKNEWIYLSENVNGFNIEYKSFNTWVQVIKVGEFKDGSGADLNVSEFKQYIKDILNCLATKYTHLKAL